MLQLKGIVAGRFLWQLGTNTVGKYGLASLQNCAITLVDHPVRPFCWAFDMLMLGSGVGFNIQREYVYKMPPVKDNDVKVVRQDSKDADFIVPDSREGWVKLLENVLIAHFYTGESFTYSTICVRPKGAPIKGFGGTASGPEDLCFGIEQISRVLSSRRGKQLRPIDCLDVMNIIGYIVVSGNVRRSAEIAIGDMDDRQFLNAKRWDLGDIPNWRRMSNNSVVCNDINLLPEEFWQGYMGNGEAYGLINLKLAREVGRLVDGNKYPDKKIVGFNPCITGDTLIAVADGRNAVPIEKLVGTQFPVYSIKNGKVIISNAVKTWKTRENAEIWKLTLDDGSILKATPDHLIMLRNGNFCCLKDLKVGDRLTPFNSYISNNHYRQIASNTGRDRRQYRLIAEHNGLIVDAKSTAIHHKDFDSFNDDIDNLQSMSHESHQALHRKGMLGENNAVFRIKNKDLWRQRLGQKSYGSKNCNFKGLTNEELFHLVVEKTTLIGRLLTTKEYFEISPKIPKQFSKYRKDVFNTIGSLLKNAALQCNLITSDDLEVDARAIRSRYNHQVASVEFVAYEDVYDITVEETHNFGVITSYQDSKYITTSGIFVHNCAEQSLEDKETCCLAEMFLPNITSKEELLKVIKYLYRIAKHSLALDCHHKDTEQVVHRNMRMGIGVTGYLQATEEQRGWLPDAYEFLRQFDREYSRDHGWPCSIKLTTTKPSGTLSLLAGVTPGAHPGLFQYFIRRIRMASDSYLVPLCKAKGYKVEFERKLDKTEDLNTVVVEFPCSHPKGTVLAKDVKAVDQLNWVKRLQTEWSDNAVSCSIYYSKEELPEIKDWLRENYNLNTKTVSFMLRQDHGFDQAPYEEITEDQYNDLRFYVEPFEGDLDKSFDLIDSFECSSGICPVK